MTSEKQRARLHFRSWHRGTREMDLLLGSFADLHLRALSDAQLTEYEMLLEESDPELYNWVTGKEPLPNDKANSVMKLFCEHKFIGGQI